MVLKFLLVNYAILVACCVLKWSFYTLDTIVCEKFLVCAAISVSRD